MAKERTSLYKAAGTSDKVNDQDACSEMESKIKKVVKDNKAKMKKRLTRQLETAGGNEFGRVVARFTSSTRTTKSIPQKVENLDLAVFARSLGTSTKNA